MILFVKLLFSVRNMFLIRNSSSQRPEQLSAPSPTSRIKVSHFEWGQNDSNLLFALATKAFSIQKSSLVTFRSIFLEPFSQQKAENKRQAQVTITKDVHLVLDFEQG